jgi:hypothetical protein
LLKNNKFLPAYTSISILKPFTLFGNKWLAKLEHHSPSPSQNRFLNFGDTFLSVSRVKDTNLQTKTGKICGGPKGGISQITNFSSTVSSTKTRSSNHRILNRHDT